MAKMKMRLRDKARIIIKWMRKHKDYGLVASCSSCQSTRVRREKSTEEEKEGTVFYSAIYECMDCHSIAVCTETWSKSGH